jgi:murein L,D-transpeptidase YcbB/YkuD
MRQFLAVALSGAMIVTPALAAAATTGVPTPKPAPPRTAAKPHVPRAGATLLKSSEPTFDEGTAQRINAAMLSYSALEVRGGWPVLPNGAKLVPGAHGSDVALLRQRLAMTDDLPANEVGGYVYDEPVVAAVRHFQARHGLPESGIVDKKTLAALNVPVSKRLRQLGASLDRLSGFDFMFAQRYVVVNIPAAIAEAVTRDHVDHRYVVVVGKPDRPSPLVATMITTVNLNPTWTVPLSILKKDIMTRMRRDPGYISRMKMRVLDSKGGEINPRSIDWKSIRSPNFTVRQDSGPGNALGAVRLDMPNKHSVYMHDTNHKNLFSKDYRFQSSGCARVENVRDLAAWLLEDNQGWDRKRIDAAIAKGERTNVRLTYKVPVAWVYLTGWATRDGQVHFRDDIYGWDKGPAEPMKKGPPQRVAMSPGRKSGFVLQSSKSQPPKVREVSILDSL